MNLNYFVGQKEGFWTGCGGTLRRARQADHCEFQAILVARVSSRTASGQDYTEKGTLSRKRQKAGFCAGVCMCLQVCFMIYFICNGVKVWGRTWMQVPIKSRRGSQISWNWSFRLPDTGAGNRTGLCRLVPALSWKANPFLLFLNWWTLQRRFLFNAQQEQRLGHQLTRVTRELKIMLFFFF